MHALFGALLAFDLFRTLHHAMWGDELQAWMIAAASPDLLALFRHLHYEGHPGLWHLLLWGITRVTADPRWMQVAHAAIAAGVWLLIYRVAPFDPWEKILLLVGYLFFWEYFVLSRNYALMALLGFAVVALRAGARRGVLAWIFLGLLANTVVYGTIWSIATAVFLAAESLREKRRTFVLGGAVYVLLLALAVAAMAPAPDQRITHGQVRSMSARLGATAVVPLDALVPFPILGLRDVPAFLAHPRTAPLPKFWNPLPARRLAQVLQLGSDHPARVAGIVAAAIVAAWMIVRERWLLAEFATGYAGVLLFTFLWGFPGSARHHGVVLLMLVGVAWLARARAPRAARAWVWWAILAVNAMAGFATLPSELRPFSEGRNVAAWLTHAGLADGVLLGSIDAPVSTVAGYLGRPIYYLECECARTFPVWDERRQIGLDPLEVGRRIERALDASGHADAVLILSHELAPATVAATAPRLAFTPLQAFPRAVISVGRFYLYRVTVERS